MVYVVVNDGVRWVWGLTSGFAGVFGGDFEDYFLGVWNEVDGGSREATAKTREERKGREGLREGRKGRTVR